jgi:hypothetical protein
VYEAAKAVFSRALLHEPRLAALVRRQQAAEREANMTYPKISHFNKLLIRVGFYVSCITCNLFHIMNLLLSYQFEGDKYKRTEYIDLECEFKFSSGAQTMPDKEHSPWMSDFLWIATVVNVLFAVFGVIVVRIHSFAYCTFRLSLFLNCACQVLVLVKSTQLTYMTYTVTVSVVAVAAGLMTGVGICRHNSSASAAGTTAAQLALKPLSDCSALAEALNHCLVRLHLRITLLFGYVSMVVWIGYIYAPEYCSETNFPISTVASLGGILFGLFFFTCLIRRENINTWDSQVKNSHGQRIDYALKFVYLVYTLIYYYYLGSFYKTDIADYRSRFQPALSSPDPAFVTQCNFECSTLCTNFINLAKNAWLMAMLMVTVLFYIVAWCFESDTGNFVDSPIGKCSNSGNTDTSQTDEFGDPLRQPLSGH